jgi:hypothetical protein
MPWQGLDTRAVEILSVPAATRPLAVVAVVLSPVIAGAALYYALRRSRPEVADFANTMSLVGFLAWMTLPATGLLPRIGIGLFVGSTFLGLAIAVLIVRSIIRHDQR